MGISISKTNFIVRRIYDILFPPPKVKPTIPSQFRSWANDAFEPTLSNPISQLCTSSQFKEEEFLFWTAEMKEAFRSHRKLWEFVYILQSLQKNHLLTPSKRGLGFGIGKEPLPAVMAKYGVEVLATDLDTEKAASEGWVQSNQHARTLADLNSKGICDPERFEKLVRFEFADMNNISKNYKDFDFCWSACALEHLGSLDAGLNFIENSLECLKPGGVAIHTTEYNCLSDKRTVSIGGTVIYRMRDFLHFGGNIRKNGHEISFNFNQGQDAIDRYVDIAPYSENKHLKLELMQYTTTSIGLIIKKSLHESK